MVGEGVLFSAVFGMYARYPEVILDGWDKLIVTDCPDKVSAHSCWTVVHVSKPHKENAISNRAYKWLSHVYPELKRYQYVMYFDSKVSLQRNLNHVVQCAISEMDEKKKLALFFQHPDRDCIYDEIKPVLHWGKDVLSNTEPWAKKLNAEEYPAHYGLTENNIFLRVNTNAHLNHVMDEMYMYMHRGDIRRDQLVFMYCLWKRNMMESVLRKPHKDKTQQYIQTENSK